MLKSTRNYATITDIGLQNTLPVYFLVRKLGIIIGMNLCRDRQDDRFVHFLNYDFKNDDRFQQGIRKLANCSLKDEDCEEYLNAKLFYYSKYFVPISRQEFVDWKMKSESADIVHCEEEDFETCSKRDFTNESSVEKENITENNQIGTSLDIMHSNNISGCQQSLSENLSDKCVIQNTPEQSETSSHDCKPEEPQNPEDCPHSFCELVELIRCGKPIPGLVQIKVEPTNAALTPSTINRIKKPWEKSPENLKKQNNPADK